MAELAAELEAFLTGQSLRDVILRSDPLAMARLMTLVQSMRPDLTANERERLGALLPELQQLEARHQRGA